jgi:hypothetical protein
MDATLGFGLTIPSTLDAVEEPENVDIKQERENQPKRNNRVFNPKNVPKIVPNAETLHAKKKSGVNVPVSFSRFGIAVFGETSAAGPLTGGRFAP